jgi:hypothetical protein
MTVHSVKAFVRHLNVDVLFGEIMVDRVGSELRSNKRIGSFHRGHLNYGENRDRSRLTYSYCPRAVPYLGLSGLKPVMEKRD